MNKLSALIIALAIPMTSLAQDDLENMKALVKNDMLVFWGGNDFSCEMDRINMNMFLKEEDIKQYTDCTKTKKENLNKQVIKSNAHLTKKNYLKTKESLRKYHDSVIELLSIPPSTKFSSKSEINMQNATAESIQRRIKVDLNRFFMDLREEETL